MLLSQLVASDYIDVYDAYSNGKRVIVQGRIIDSKDKKDKNSKLIESFFNDEKKEVAIQLTVNNLHYKNQSDNEGYFSFDIEVANTLKTPTSVTLETNEKNSLQTVQLFQPSSQKHIGVISDFDDTVIVSNVTEKAKLLYNTFMKNYKEREVVDEVKNKIVQLTQKQKNTALFFITGSPHQLQNAITTFLDYHHFPKRTLLTKKVHGANSDDLLASVAYKYNKIVKLIEMYPHITWVTFGDSGEKDPEIYLKVLKNYPDHVQAIYIRDVQTKKVNQLVHNTLAPFSTDGCSYFPDGTLEHNEQWLNCCVEHDKAYWKGGTKKEREIADNVLQQCVADVGYPNIAKMMHLGVRIGGSSKYDTSYRWGYGWKINHHDNALSNEELAQVETMKRKNK